jgi:hypothetical protein
MIFSSTGRLYEYSSTRSVCNFIVYVFVSVFLLLAYIFFSLTYRKLTSPFWLEIKIFYRHTHLQWDGINNNNKNVVTTYGVRTTQGIGHVATFVLEGAVSLMSRFVVLLS